MITKYDADTRGRTRLDWLDGRHSFSFGGWQDPERMGFRSLRVLNDDVVEPGSGFGMHPHRDMEIVTWILSGALEHKDDMGNGSVIRRGDAQRMSAGTGVMHSEWNPSESERTTLLQIWILPEETGTEPGYEETRFEDDALDGRLALIASRDGRDGSVTIRQDAEIRIARLAAGAEVSRNTADGRHLYVHAARGEGEVNGEPIATGDGFALSEESVLRIRATAELEIVLFDLA